MANCGILLNDGTSFLLLNSGDFYLLNDNSCATEPGATPPVVVVDTIPPGGGSLEKHIHRGSLYWKRYQEELRSKKKKKSKKEELLEELDQHLVELNARIDEVPVEEIEPNWVADLRRTEAFAYNELVTEHTNKEILVYLTILREITQEMDDEDAIILALH
jgi:hypothetical protein